MRKLAVILINLLIINFLLAQQIDSLKKAAQKASSPLEKAKIYLKISYFAYNYQNDSLFKYIERTVKYAKQANNLKLVTQALSVKGYYYRLIGKTDSAFAIFDSCLRLAFKIPDSASIAAAYGNIANTYLDRANYPKAIEFYRKTLKIFEKQNNIYGLATTYGALGNTYLAARKYNFALENYNKALELFTKIYKQTNDWGALNYIGVSLMNKGIIYKNLGKLDSAKYFLDSSITIFKQIKDEVSLNQAYANLAQTFFNAGQYKKSIKYARMVSKYFLKNGLNRDLILTGMQIATAYDKLNNHQAALNTLLWLKPYLNFTDIDLDKQRIFYQLLAKAFYKTRQPDSAYKYLNISYNLFDSLLTITTQKNVEEALAKFKADQKQKEIEFLRREKQLQAKTIRNQRIIITLVITGFIVVSLFLIILTYLLSKLNKANSKLKELNAAIMQQKEEILTQKEEIERQNKKITESINYASRIQRALLPNKQVLDNTFAENFIIYLPKEIVSGDFYWFYRRNDKILISVADCTGHGVPGALMSMLGISFLNEIVKTSNFQNAAEILDKMRIDVKTSLKQYSLDKYWQSKEGIDMALIIIDLKTLQMHFAGAYNPILIITQNAQMIELKGDKMPVGIYIKEKPHFTNHTLQLHKNDLIYMFTDGYIDQFGEKNGRKFLYKNFKKLILQIAHLPMNQQQDIILNTFNQWKGSRPQLDDVTILGIRV